MLFPVAGPSTASAPSCIGDATAKQGALYIFHQPRFSTALLDCEWNAQAAQAAHARRFKQLKLSGPTAPTKERVEPDWRRLWKEDPVLFMALYKADYMYTTRRQVHGALQAD
jgi:hypothetical protein